MSSAEGFETIWFRIFALVATAIIAGYSVANIVYYNRIRHATTVNVMVTHAEATSMMWMSILVFIVAAILFIWSLVRIILGQRTRDHLVHKIRTFADSDESVVVAAGQGYNAVLRQPTRSTVTNTTRAARPVVDTQRDTMVRRVVSQASD